jgi:hypothetical protein
MASLLGPAVTEQFFKTTHLALKSNKEVTSFVFFFYFFR